MTTGASIAESSLKPSNMEGVDFTNSPLTEKVKASVHSIIDEIAVKADKTENELRAKAATNDETLLDKEDLLGTELQDYVKKVQLYVQEHPLESLGLAVGTGYLLSRVLKQ